MEKNFKGVVRGFTSLYTKEGIPNPYIRGGLWAVTIIIVYVSGKSIYKSIFPSQNEKRIKEAVKLMEIELQKEVSKKPLSYALPQYDMWANAIAKSFEGCDYTSIGIYSNSYSTINNIFKQLKSNSDYLQLIKSYGIRSINKGFLCGGDYVNLDLATAIGRQLTQVEIEKGMGVFPSLNKTLEQQGITYRITNV